MIWWTQFWAQSLEPARVGAKRWFERSVRDTLIEVSHATSVISGRVLGESGGPAGGCAVIVFSTDRERWFATSSYLRRAQASPDGSFRVGGLPPGDYYVAAVDPEGSVDSGEWQEPEALRALTTAARRVTLGEGEPDVTELHLIRRQGRQRQ